MRISWRLWLLGTPRAILFPSLCLFLQFLLLRMRGRDAREDEWNIYERDFYLCIFSTCRNFSENVQILTWWPHFFFSSVTLLTFFFCCWVVFFPLLSDILKPSLFERMDITETTSRLPGFSCSVLQSPSSTPKLIFLSVNARHGIFRLHFSNF